MSIRYYEKNKEALAHKANRNNDPDDYEPRFVKKDEEEKEEKKEEEKSEQKAIFEAIPEVKGIIGKLRKLIFPLSNQQRNLDRETGGIESDVKKGSFTSDDIWDERSEEVDKMGSAEANKFNSTGIRSLIWRNKKKMLEGKKHHKEMAKDAAIGMAALNTKKSKSIDSRNQPGQGFFPPQQGYVARLKNLKQDHSHENTPGGGAWR